MRTMACGQLVVVCRVPYPMVCCVSIEKRNTDTKPSASEMQGPQSSCAMAAAEKSPCE